MLQIADLTLGYGCRTLVQGLSLRVAGGEVLAVLGPNGAGKSTFIRTVAALHPARSGQLRLDDQDLVRMKVPQRARQLAYLAQSTHAVATSVFDAVLLGRMPHFGWHAGQDDLQRVQQILARLGLLGLAARRCTELSGGELQKVLIARALAQQPRLLLLDEPVNHLDLANQLEVLALVRQAACEEGLVALVVLHDLNLALRFADRYLLLQGPQGCHQGRMHELQAGQVEQVYRVPVVRGTVGGHSLIVPA